MSKVADNRTTHRHKKREYCVKLIKKAENDRRKDTVKIRSQQNHKWTWVERKCQHWVKTEARMYIEEDGEKSVTFCWSQMMLRGETERKKRICADLLPPLHPSSFPPTGPIQHDEYKISCPIIRESYFWNRGGEHLPILLNNSNVFCFMLMYSCNVRGTYVACLRKYVMRTVVPK